MKKTKMEKGITLIALIITIVVLLILGSVSIGAIKDSGIIQYAKNARSEYEQAQTNEATMLDSYLKELDEATKEEGLTTEQAVEAGLKVGNYVEYPVQYSNVGTWVDLSSGQVKGNYPADSYVGWRVLSIEGEGANKYIRLVSAGVPLNYYHYDNSATTVTNLTTGFFSTPINSTVTQYNFYSCGFKDVSENAVTSIDGVKTLFTNKYTQMEGTTPKVQTITKADIDAVWGSDTEGESDLTSDDLLAIPCKSPGVGESAMTWLAAADGVWYVWHLNYGGGMDSSENDILRGSSGSCSKARCQNNENVRRTLGFTIDSNKQLHKG